MMGANGEDRYSAREKYAFYNSLAVLLKAIEGQKTTVDLRNESSVYGTIAQADGFMNVVMKDCIFTDPRGDAFAYDAFFVQSRNIRLVHIPPNIPIVPAINDQLHLLYNPGRRTERKKPTFKSKRAETKHKEDTAAVAEILKKEKETAD